MNKRQKKTKRAQNNRLAGTSKQSGQDSFDSIPMTRQLKTKKQARNRIKRTPMKRTMNKRSDSQNQPMPTFKDLEKMFEEPASINSAPNASTSNSINTSTNLSTTEDPTLLNIIENSRKDVNTDNSQQSDERVKIPDRIGCDTSIETINLIDTVITKVIDCNEIIIIDYDEDYDEPELIHKERKRKLNSLENSCVKLEEVDNNKPQKVRKLEILDLPKDDNGSDSDVTIVYDLEAPPVLSPVSSSPYKRFSPLPSTSTDNETILKNDKIFMECLSANNCCIKIQEVNRTDKQELTDVIDVDELPSVSTSTRIESSEPIEIDDVVTSIDDEIDVDEIIAYNRSILTKYKAVEELPGVIEVAPVQNIASNVTHNVSDCIEVIDSSAIRQNTNQRILSAVATDISSFTNSTTSSTVTAPIGTPRNIPRSTNITNNMLTNMNTSSINYTNPTNNTLRSVAQSNINQISTPTIVNTSSLASSSQSPEVSTGLNCPICLDNLRSTECASTLCGHIFCMDCIKRALRSSKRCPTCRKTIKGNNGYHRLFL